MEKFQTFEEFLDYVNKRNFYNFDSEHTLNTRELIKQFGAKGVHMNRHWAQRGFNWSCPSCNRTKSEIVRLNKHGDLSCQLHEHHDHTPDIAKELFTHASVNKRFVIADLASEQFVRKISEAFESYSPTVVCTDCNNADTIAKKAADVHKWFSFSPKDIEEMITVSANREHIVNNDKAIEIWNRKQKTFYLRIELIKEFIHIAANKDDWYEPSKRSYRDYTEFRDIPSEMRSWLYTSKDYSEKSIKDRREWRLRPKNKFYNAPTDQEIEFAINTSNYSYDKIPDDWHCSICDRSKRETFQKSKKQNIWGMRREEVTFYNQEKASICNECLITIRGIKKELNGTTNAAPKIITIEEAKSFILPKANNRHAIDNDVLDILLDTIKPRLTDEEDDFF
jgi:rubredoxin